VLWFDAGYFERHVKAFHMLTKALAGQLSHGQGAGRNRPGSYGLNQSGLAENRLL